MVVVDVVQCSQFVGHNCGDDLCVNGFRSYHYAHDYKVNL
jgi:hypothetical protein